MNDAEPLAGATDIQPDAQKHGARVYKHKDGVYQVKQTVKRGTAPTDPYVIDEHRERFIDASDDAALGAAVRAALEGRL